MSDFKPVVPSDHGGKIPTVVFLEKHDHLIAEHERPAARVVLARMCIVTTLSYAPVRAANGGSDMGKGSRCAIGAVAEGQVWQTDRRLYRYGTEWGRTIDWRELRKDFERQGMALQDDRPSNVV